MRGILQCWIKQADRVEEFKRNQNFKFSLHSKFNLTTGDEILKDSDYNHLQIDNVSLYLIFLVQMISSGLQIIYTQDEVAFVQNLVYYVERAYRTPDFGMWERGTKYNDGTPEIHASSIGMAKSALESINGCNLFGEKGASWSVIYVDIDAHNRNRSIFETLLPRESSTKAEDASLLMTVSFPAFATHEVSLVVETKKHLHSLKGKYGFKRFIRDGYKSVLEDPSRRFYKVSESKEFENIESEWPLFLMFMIIDGVYHGDNKQIKEYQTTLKSILRKDSNGDPVIPMYFYVKNENLAEEKANPGSQERVSSVEGSGDKNPLFLWNQAVFVISQLLTSGLLHINELDPVKRHLPSFSRPRKNGRYSAFQGTATDLVVQIVLIAESMRLQAMMATYGIQTQTPHEVEPIQIWSSNQLVKVYENLGVNSKLRLKGRPPRPVGALGTSKFYRVAGTTVLCYPLIFEVSEFYLYRDMALLIEDIKTELQFVSRYWRLSGRPTFCLLIREDHMRDPQFKEMLDLMAMLKKGCCEGIKVRTGRLQNLISSSCVEHLDFVNMLDPSETTFQQFDQLEHEYIGYQSLTDIPLATCYNEKFVDYKAYQYKSIPDIIDALRSSPGMFSQAQLLGHLLNKCGANYEVQGKTVTKHLEDLHSKAGCHHYWAVVRYCSSLLNHTVDSIGPFITAVLVSGKQLTIGVISQEETVFEKPLTPAEFQSIIYSTIHPHSVIEAVLQQEIVLYCGRLIATSPHLFRGILKIRVGWVVEAMKIYLEISQNEETLENLSPFQVRQLLSKILSVSEWASKEQLCPLARRRLEGCLCRVPKKFYQRVWCILSRTLQGVKVKGCVLPHQPELSDMTSSELRFSLLIEQALNKIQEPEYRQIIVELLCIVSTILQRNPELTFNNELNLDDLVMEAFAIYCKDTNRENCNDVKIFFSETEATTLGYFARAIVNNVLKGGHFTMSLSSEDGNNCAVS
ncbi:probable phosphorylase b kinase regulatory subunit beta isoform X2 [Cimex lectularius]|nr:probable phosphorylase b kinase regulatory subunit beta isoform X2 [Cimex lectularius]